MCSYRLAGICIIAWGILLLGNEGLAASVTLQRTVSFGNITAHPGGDRITIDASSGENTPVSRTGYSILLNGISGKISFDSSDVGQPVLIAFPAQMVLTCQWNSGKTLVIDNIDINSTQAFIIQAPVQEIHVGGRLNIEANQYPCAYSGNLSLTIVY